MKLLSVTKSVKYCLNGTLRHLKMTNDIFPSKFSAKKNIFSIFWHFIFRVERLKEWLEDQILLSKLHFLFQNTWRISSSIVSYLRVRCFLMLQSKLIFVSFHLSYLIYQNYSKGNHTSYWRKTAFVAKKYLRVVDSICCNNDHLNSFDLISNFQPF